MQCFAFFVNLIFYYTLLFVLLSYQCQLLDFVGLFAVLLQREANYSERAPGLASTLRDKFFGRCEALPAAPTSRPGAEFSMPIANRTIRGSRCHMEVSCRQAGTNMPELGGTCSPEVR